ncbi:F-box protein-like protein [Tanacetum coccineum]
MMNNSLHFSSSNPVIDCLNLRVLELFHMHISEELLHNLFSTCKLLEKINLQAPKGLKKIQVNKLQHLRELIIVPSSRNDSLEIFDVPSLHSIFYDATSVIWMPVLSNTGSIGSLRELYIDFVSMDHALSDMINSKFHFLEILTLHLTSCSTKIVDIRCVSLRRLKIHLMTKTQMKVKVSAPNLLYLGYECITLPSFVFPSIAPKQIELKGSWEKSLIVDAFFSIFRPNYVVINHPLTYEVVNYFMKLNVKEAKENKAGKVYWPHLGEIREPLDGKWETLSSSSSSSYSSLLDDWCEFKINWCAP